MDHLCVCENGNSKAWYKAPGRFSGTSVKNILIKLLCEYSFSLPVMFFKYKYH